ncbi:MAG: LytTR family DNA-binding domain-containing protein [Saprospiraceae bacterium]|nr:LytTR family DNA-binding domain-containing protein [Saprospiraceae bacterium]
MVNWLGQPYPLTVGWHTSLRSGLIAGLVVSVFLFVFRPFGMGFEPGLAFHFIGVCLLFGLVTLLASALWGLGKKWLIGPDAERTWTVGKAITDTLGLIALIGVGNWILSAVLFGESLTASNLWRWERMTLAVATAPVAVGFLLSYLNLVKKYRDIAARADAAIHQRSTSPAGPQFIILEGENKEDRLTVPAAQLLLITSADNYVEIRHFTEEGISRTLLRSTLKRMENSLSGHPQFMRCHRTAIVNLDYVERISGNAQGLRLHLRGLADPIPVSRQLTGDSRLQGGRR